MSRATPRRASTPADGLRMAVAGWRTLAPPAAGSAFAACSAFGEFIHLFDVFAVHKLVRNEQFFVDLFAVDRFQQVWDADFAVALREVGGVGDPLRVVFD